MIPIKTYATVAVVAAATTFIASACGGSGYGTSASPPRSSTAAKTISLREIAGTGEVLVDSHGDALYTSDQEAHGKVLCTGSCTSIWLPATLPAGRDKPSASRKLMAELGVVRRPDGATQVTFHGRPLYRFAEDPGAGQVTGDGKSDSFDGKSFTWHVAGPNHGSTGSTSGGGGYGY
jgi:predicted lipoprotein with Yx(FWY)xxD motif